MGDTGAISSKVALQVDYHGLFGVGNHSLTQQLEWNEQDGQYYDYQSQYGTCRVRLSFHLVTIPSRQPVLLYLLIIVKFIRVLITLGILILVFLLFVLIFGLVQFFT